MAGIIDTLITDRTYEDVSYWKSLKEKGFSAMTSQEQEEWLSGLKGSYTPKFDMNRVTSAMKYLAERFCEYGYTVKLIPVRVWDIGDKPTQEEMEDYLSNVFTIRKVLTMTPNIPTVPTDMQGFTWQEANDIEKILMDLNEALILIAQSFLRCGNATTYCDARGLPTEYILRPITWAELDAKMWTWADWDQKTWNQLLYGR